MSALWTPADRLRAQGLTLAQIGERLGTAPATASFYMDPELRRLSHHDLGALRRVACAPEDAMDVVAEARYERTQQAHNKRMQRHYRWRKLRPSLVRLDYVSEHNFSTHELIGAGEHLDPYNIVSGRLDYGHILGRLSIEDVEHLDDESLRHLQRRLVDAGIQRTIVQPAERAKWNRLPKRERIPSRKSSSAEVVESLGGQDMEWTDYRDIDRRHWESRSQRRRRRRLRDEV